MAKAIKLQLAPVDKTRWIKGVRFPEEVGFRQMIVTGPPGCGKSSLVRKIGGWPDEGFIDLTIKSWWRSPLLAFRPREVHLGFPFFGYPESLAVTDKEWQEAPEPPVMECSRIILPPPKTSFWRSNWRARYAFIFMLPPAEKIYAFRTDPKQRGAHPVDEGVTLALVKRQLTVYQEAALHFRRENMMIYVVDDFDAVPKTVLEPSRE